MAGDLPFQTLKCGLDPAADPVLIEPESAQRWCNFVLYSPAELPWGCELATGTLRREAPPGRPEGPTSGRTPWSNGNPSAYRFEIVGDGRRLRIKEFLYDWNFPALDHPCLWESGTRAVAMGDRYVLWLGTDYLKNAGASARLARTTIELSVLAGRLTEAEIVALYQAMRPVDPVMATRIHDRPFATLSYWSRHPDVEMVTTPVGLWDFRREHDEGAHEGVWRTPPDTDSTVRRFGAPTVLGGFPLDSVGEFTNAAGQSEVEIVYSGGPDRGHELRLIVQHVGAGRLVVPAARSPHPGSRTERTIAGTPVQLAWIDPGFGPFDAVFSHGGVEAKLLSSAGVSLGEAWFEGAVAELVRAFGQHDHDRRSPLTAR